MPFQKVQSFQITPIQVEFRSKAKTKNFQPFELPGVFTIQPRKSNDALVTYAERVLEMDHLEIKRLVTGMIEGLVRASAARMDMLTLFNNRDAFKKEIENEVAQDLTKLGFEVTTSNIKELEDPEGVTFFHDLSQRTLAAAHAEARVATAEANRTGETGEKVKDMETRKSVAAAEIEAVMAENQRDQQIAESTADLQIKQAEYHRNVEVARIQAVKAKEVREAELQAEVEQARRKQEEAQKRANELTTANVNAEVRVREAEGLRDAAIKQAEGEAEAAIRRAEGERTAAIRRAEGEAESMRLKAEADLAVALKRAEGVQAEMSAVAVGTREQLAAYGGDVNAVMMRVLVDSGLLPKLAEANAKGLQGLNPSINIWRTGGGDDSGRDAFAPIANAMSNLPPLLSQLEKAGIRPPAWLMDASGGKVAASTATAAARL